MSLSVVIPPYAEPLTLSEMKNHLKVETSVTEDDALISSQIVAARDLIETMTGANSIRNNIILATTYDYGMMSFFDETSSGYDSWHKGATLSRGAYYDSWYFNICVPCVPLISVTSITYIDVDGVTQTLSSSLYSITDPAKGVITLNYGESWPTTRWQPNAVTVRFVAGMAATFTASATTSVLTFSGRSFTVGDRVRVMNSGGALPGGLQANTDYFVIASSKLSLTSSGAAVSITSVGSGTNYIGLSLTGFETLRVAVKLLVGFWYENRAAVDTGRQAVGATILPMAVESLIASVHA